MPNVFKEPLGTDKARLLQAVVMGAGMFPKVVRLRPELRPKGPIIEARAAAGWDFGKGAASPLPTS